MLKGYRVIAREALRHEKIRASRMKNSAWVVVGMQEVVAGVDMERLQMYLSQRRNCPSMVKAALLNLLVLFSSGRASMY